MTNGTFQAALNHYQGKSIYFFKFHAACAVGGAVLSVPMPIGLRNTFIRQKPS